jgi:hypothetical protein
MIIIGIFLALAGTQTLSNTSVKIMDAARYGSTRLTASSLVAQKRRSYCVNGVGRAPYVAAARQGLQRKMETRRIGQGEARS